jgi:uncharacterized cupredoxin-like copper-binding protein
VARRLALAGAFASAACLSACGAHVVTVNSTEIRFRLDEFSIAPQNVRVRAAPRIKISVINVGVETHDLVVEAEYQAANGDPIPYNTAIILQPGQMTTFKLVNLKPGRYKLVDTVADHVDLGEYGTLTVVK